MSNGAISKMSENSRRKSIDALLAIFPDLSESWLLTGKGEMIDPGYVDYGYKHRISEYCYTRRMSELAFEQECGFSENYIALMKGALSEDDIDKIQSAFPDLNTEWLLTGKGGMFRQLNFPKEEEETRPRIPNSVAAGTLKGFAESVLDYDCDCFPVVKSFPQYEYTIIVRGDSMEPKFENGDEIAIRRVVDTIEWGKVYVLDTADGAILKRLYDNGDTFRCVSYNKEYGDMLIRKDRVFGVYQVVGLLRV